MKHLIPHFFLICFLIATLCLSLSACSHEHNYGEWEIIRDSTCTVKGEQVRFCPCGEKETESIDATGHIEIIDDAITATCTESGRSEGKHCSICKETLQLATVFQPLQHAFNDVKIINEATCLNKGTKRFTCTRENCCVYYDEDFSLKEYSSTEIYNQALKYTGEILTYDKNGDALAQGTGFIYSSDGKIITNYHVIDGAYSATITIGEDTYAIQTVLAYDADIDLAILKINATGLTPANVCKNDPVTAETVYAIGSPRGFTATVSVGVVSYAKRVVNDVTYVQHDADITYGSSGGPLINKYGEVIGVNAGAFGNAEINVAVFTGELDNLTYGTPLTMAELFELNYTANNALSDWLIDNYNYSSGSSIYYEIAGEDFIYSIAYDTEDDYNYIEGFWEFESNKTLYISVNLDSTTGIYTYYAHYSDNTNDNYTYGTINAASYTTSTLLTHYSFVGEYWDKETLMVFYTRAMVNTMEWFSYCLDNYINELSLADFGFTSLSYTYNTYALDSLNTHIRLKGTYYSSGQWYEINKTYDYKNYFVYLTLAYIPSTNSTFVSMGWFGDNGVYYHAYLSLNTLSLTSGTFVGNYFGCRYSETDAKGHYVDLNYTQGYLNPAIFTTLTIPTYDEYDGLPEKEEFLLKNYSYCLQDLLKWLSNYLEDNYLGYTLADLGFIFFYG